MKKTYEKPEVKALEIKKEDTMMPWADTSDISVHNTDNNSGNVAD